MLLERDRFIHGETAMAHAARGPSDGNEND
jgi:hypothetical protein